MGPLCPLSRSIIEKKLCKVFREGIQRDNVAPWSIDEKKAHQENNKTVITAINLGQYLKTSKKPGIPNNSFYYSFDKTDRHESPK